MGGGSDNRPQPTQQSTFQMSPEQQELTQLALPGIRNFAASVPQRYQGSTVAGFTDPQVAGQNMALGAAGTQAGLSDTANATFGRLTGDLTDVNSNPALRGAIDAAVRPISQQLTESTLPAIRGGAVGAGQYGSTRQALSEGIASREASVAAGDTAAKLANATYDTNIKAQLSALGLLPTLQTGAVAPALTTSAVGDVQQAQNQSQLNSTISGFNYDQLAPYLQSRDLLSLVAGIPGGTNISTANNPPAASNLSKALGGAAAGASLGTAIMPGIGTGVGAAGGALLPFLFN